MRVPAMSSRSVATSGETGTMEVMTARHELPVIELTSPDAWASWLDARHADSHGVWLKIAKKVAGIDALTYAEALDVALCFGWIDGQKAKFDDEFWLQRFTPRRTKSKWSQRNRTRALELIDTGEMQAPGLREVEQAKADGRWDAAYAAQSTATVPDDLRRALKKNKKAADFFAGLDSHNRYAILYRIQNAKKPETRARRVEHFVTMLQDGRAIHP
jgi:uncharacterized protein YdeI (YjbR/CyaY-like superfamily)